MNCMASTCCTSGGLPTLSGERLHSAHLQSVQSHSGFELSKVVGEFGAARVAAVLSRPGQHRSDLSRE